MGEAIISRSGGGSGSDIVTPPTPTANMHMLMLKVTDSSGSPLKDWPVKCANKFYYHTNEAGYVTFATNTNLTQIDVAPYAYFDSEGIHADYPDYNKYNNFPYTATIYADQGANCVNFETPIGLSQVSSIKLKDLNSANLNFLNMKRYNVFSTNTSANFNIYTNNYESEYGYSSVYANKLFTNMPLNIIFVKERRCNLYISGGGGGGGFYGGGGAGGEQKEINNVLLKGTYKAFIGLGGNGGWEKNADYNNYCNNNNIVQGKAGGSTFFGIYSVQGGNPGNNGKGGIAGTYNGNGANQTSTWNVIALGENSGMKFGGGGSSSYCIQTDRYYSEWGGWESTQNLAKNNFFTNNFAKPYGGFPPFAFFFERNGNNYASVTRIHAATGGGGGGGALTAFSYTGGKRAYDLYWGLDGGYGDILISY